MHCLFLFFGVICLNLLLNFYYWMIYLFLKNDIHCMSSAETSGWMLSASWCQLPVKLLIYLSNHKQFLVNWGDLKWLKQSGWGWCQSIPVTGADATATHPQTTYCWEAAALIAERHLVCNTRCARSCHGEKVCKLNSRRVSITVLGLLVVLC